MSLYHLSLLSGRIYIFVRLIFYKSQDTHIFQILDDGVEELLVVDEPVGDGGHRRRVVAGGVSALAGPARCRVRGGGGRLQLGQSRRDGRADAVGQVGLVLRESMCYT